MIALLVGLLLSGPAANASWFTAQVAADADACDESGYPLRSASECRATCSWWSPAETRCRDADVQVLGGWDARPAPGDWPSSTYVEPPSFGAFPLEKRE